jgi:hypothetical protein
MPTPQTYQNHTRFDPPWHFFIAPFLLLNVIFAIYLTIHHWPQHWAPLIWYVLLSIVMLFAVGKARAHSMVVQDRVIRLEEKLRFSALLPHELLARTPALTLRQIIALRFVSDDELPAMVQRTLDENLSEKDIKKSINKWRPDYLRV